MNRIVLALGAVVLATLTTAVRAPATPNMKGAVREPASLQGQVIHLFDRLDRVSHDIENVGADIEWARTRISELSRQIEAKQADPEPTRRGGVHDRARRRVRLGARRELVL